MTTSKEPSVEIDNLYVTSAKNDDTEHMMDLYDEIKNEDDEKPRIKPCTLKHNPRMKFYWRMVAGLHELGHSIARILLYFTTFKCFKSNEK